MCLSARGPAAYVFVWSHTCTYMHIFLHACTHTRTLYTQETAEDVMCVFPQGALSDKSAWDHEDLVAKISKHKPKHALLKVDCVLYT
jgi:hypothetical protein